MNDNPSSNFIKKIIGQNREVLLAIIKGLFYEIHELMLNDFFLEKKTSALFEIKKNESINDFSGAANLFRSEYYLNKRFTPKYNRSLGVETANKISLAKLKTSILKLKEELVREKIKGLIQNQFYNLNSIDEISRLVIDINNLRNIEEHELGNSDFSKAALLYAYINRLITLTPDHVTDRINGYSEYFEYVNYEFKELVKIYIYDDEEDKKNEKENTLNEEINFTELAKKIADEIKKDNIDKDKEITDLKNQLQSKSFFQKFYHIKQKKSVLESLSYDWQEKHHFYLDKESSTHNAIVTTSEWSFGGIHHPEKFYIPYGAMQDVEGQIYIFYDKNDPYFKNMGESANKYMFSVEDIEESWGPFDAPLEMIRELSVVYRNDSYSQEEHDAHMASIDFETGMGPEPTKKQKELVEILKSRPPIKIPIQEWEYPKHSYDKDLFDEFTKASEDADVKSASSPQAHAVSTKEKNFEKTIETIIRKTRKQAREDLLVLRNKIYTIMTNHTAFDHWDNILSTKIIKNILDNKIFTSSDFKSSDMKPGYLWKTAFKKDTELFIERDRESVELMDLQINQFWGEVQDVTRNYFFDYDYIYNNKNKPWAKASLKYSKKDFLENTILYNEVFNYLQKIIPAINIDEKPFNEFSLSFVRALNKNIDEFPNDELIWEEVGEGFVIKKIRKDSIK